MFELKSKKTAVTFFLHYVLYSHLLKTLANSLDKDHARQNGMPNLDTDGILEKLFEKVNLEETQQTTKNTGLDKQKFPA